MNVKLPLLISLQDTRNFILLRLHTKDNTSLKLFSHKTNSADTDEIPHSSAFQLCFHCLTKNLFSGFQYTKV